VKIKAFCLVAAMLFIPAQAHAADLWASYSVNPQNGNWGFATGRPSAQAAYNDARNGCGRTGCYEVLSQSANCIALYGVNRNGRRTFAAGAGSSIGAAEAVAKRKFTTPHGLHRVDARCTR